MPPALTVVINFRSSYVILSTAYVRLLVTCELHLCARAHTDTHTRTHTYFYLGLRTKVDRDLGGLGYTQNRKNTNKHNRIAVRCVLVRLSVST